MAIFDPRKPLNLAYFRRFWELYCSKLLQIWFVNVFLLVLTESGENFWFFKFLGVLVKIVHFFRKKWFSPCSRKIFQLPPETRYQAIIWNIASQNDLEQSYTGDFWIFLKSPRNRRYSEKKVKFWRFFTKTPVSPRFQKKSKIPRVTLF